MYTELKIGNITVHNRLVMPPMASETSGEGVIGDKTIQYYLDRAKCGKIGLIITEHSSINHQGRVTKAQVSIADDSCIEGMSRLVEALHGCGSKVICQINHAGSAAAFSATGMEAVGPSPICHPRKKPGSPPPLELSKEDIAALVEDFANAALRAKKAGYDGVEIHSAHGYLLNQFYTPVLNHREDEYGGSLENRIRFHLEVIKAVREKVGDDYLVALRLGGCDYIEGGSTIEDCVEAVKIFEAAGIDLIDLSGGLCGYSPAGRTGVLFRDMSEAVKAAVKIPVILTGGITSGETVKELVESGAADLIGVGRAIYKDATWAEREM